MLPVLRRVCRLISLIVVVVSVHAMSVHAMGTEPLGSQTVSDPALRAAYLFNFAKFIEWPASAGGAPVPLRVCSTDARVAEELMALVAGKVINGRSVAGAHVSVEAGARACAIVHAGGLNERQSKALLTTLDNHPIFTIGDSDRFTALGGAAHFYLERGRLRFAINLDIVRRTGLRIDPGLLTMAQIIRHPGEAASR